MILICSLQLVVCSVGWFSLYGAAGKQRYTESGESLLRPKRGRDAKNAKATGAEEFTSHPALRPTLAGIAWKPIWIHWYAPCGTASHALR